MRSSRIGLLCLVFLLLATATSRPLMAQAKWAPANPVEAAAIEFALDSAELEKLVGQQVNLLLLSGKEEKDVTLRPFQTFGKTNQIKQVVFSSDGSTRTKKYPGTQVYWIKAGERRYRLKPIPSTRSSIVEDTARHEEAVRNRLGEARQKLWEPFSDAEMAAFVDEEKTFLTRVGAYFQNLPMQLLETNYFLFFTDMPLPQVAPFVTQLDRMYETLGTAFGFPPGHNIWRGKAVVVVFVDRTPFAAFEKEFMQGSNTENIAGLCHNFPDGRVVISAVRGEDLNFFGGVLVHETAHGYNYRYLSTVNIPNWVDEGIAEWVARAAVPQAREMTRRREEAATVLRQSGSLGGDFFSGGGLSRWQYGAAHSIIDMLIHENPEQFKLFFNGIKEGMDWESSLKRAYDLTPAELSVVYGRTIGVPLLMP